MIKLDFLQSILVIAYFVIACWIVYDWHNVRKEFENNKRNWDEIYISW
jgi:hypothetical protein